VIRLLIALALAAGALGACSPTVVVNATPCYQQLPNYPTTGPNGVQALDPQLHYEQVPCH